MEQPWNFCGPTIGKHFARKAVGKGLKNAVRTSAIDYLGLAFVEWRNNVVVEQFRAMFGPRQCCVGLATGWHHFVCEAKHGIIQHNNREK